MYFPIIAVHTLHHRQRFLPVAEGTYYCTAHLEAFFYHNTDTRNIGSGLTDNGNQSLQSTAIGQKIVDDQYIFIRRKIFPGDNDCIGTIVSIGFDLSSVSFIIRGNRIGLFGIINRNIKI